MRKVNTRLFRIGLLALCAVGLNSQSQAEQLGQPLQKANGETLSAAMGHYARSRSLLIAAIQEFDKGLKLVNPDALLDVEAYRATLLQRAKDIERVLDPQPRSSKGGVRYDSDTRLLGEASKR